MFLIASVLIIPTCELFKAILGDNKISNNKFNKKLNKKSKKQIKFN